MASSRPGFTFIELITRLRSPAASFAGRGEGTSPYDRPAFTFIELIIVIAMIAIVASAVFVAIDPARRLADARNSTRWTDVRSILEAVKTYQIDHEGNFPLTPAAIDTLPGSAQMIGKGGLDCASLGWGCPGITFPSQNCFVSGFDTDLPKYLKKLPEDPRTGSANDTRYYINRDADGFLVVGACDEEGGNTEGGPPVIEASR